MSGYLRRQLGSNAIFIESDNQETGDIGLSGQENQFPVSGVELATADSEVNTVGDRGDNYHSNGQRNISDSASLLDSEQWLAMPGKTLYEIVALKDIALKDTPSDIPLWYTPSDIEDERTGKQIDDRILKAIAAVQAGSDEFVPANTART